MEWGQTCGMGGDGRWGDKDGQKSPQCSTIPFTQCVLCTMLTFFFFFKFLFASVKGGGDYLLNTGFPMSQVFLWLYSLE